MNVAFPGYINCYFGKNIADVVKKNILTERPVENKRNIIIQMQFYIRCSRLHTDCSYRNLAGLPSGDILCRFLFALLDKGSLPNWDLLLKEGV